MNSKEILQSIINEFDVKEFEKFFRAKSDRLRYPDESIDYKWEGNNFAEGRKLAEGKLDDGELIVCSFLVKQNLTARSGKKAQYNIGKKILKDQQADAGIFIFYDREGNFRFSLIYANYLGKRRDWSNFKRFTYFVNPEETNKTFIQRIGSADFSNLTSIKDAFSVEKVTKEFYQEIANWYFWALKKIKFPDDAEAEPNGRNIAIIRLITRIIFIWFMRQKGIIKKELFDKEFLKNILTDLSDKESTYYKAILQNLFFATLNTPIEQRKFRREKRYQGYLNKDYMNHTYFRYHNLFKDPECLKDIFNSIPFLNGGLFECLDKAKDDESNDTGKEIRIDGFSDDPKKQAYVPNFIFFSDEREVDLNKDYGTTNKKYKVKGLINTFLSYNFTIDENTPVDEEVALDPELLGKVFENLLASYNPETASTARKATGSYYTPREIVDYMVRESIKEYLKTKVSGIDEEKLNQLFLYDSDENPFDEQITDTLISAINNLKLLDPAVGSGAFPMGALHCLVHILHKLDPHNKKWKAEQIKAIEDILDPKLKKEIIEKIEDSFTLNELDYGRKLYLIQNCIYGVDIQPIAIHIAKLRLFISLLVDEKVDQTKPNLGVEPLPNLETKFVSANTLIGLPHKQSNQQLSLIQNSEILKLENRLKEIRSQYFIASDIKEKERLKKEDREIRKDIARILKNGGFPANSTEMIVQFDIYNTNKSAGWFDPEWMFGVNDGFDIVIGNPPYIQLQKSINNKDNLKYADLYKDQNYKTFDRTGDIYCLFYERGTQLLKHGGFLCYITSNKWMRAGYGELLREFFTKHNPKNLIDLGPGIFESATVDTCIFIIQKISNEKTNDFTGLKAVTLFKEQTIDIAKQLKERGVTLTELSSDAWFIGNSAEQRLKEKIERIGKPLKEWDVNIYRGVLTGLNEAFIITTEKCDEILANCKDKEERRRTKAIIKPILRGRDIKRYYYEWAGLWVIFIPWHFPLHEDQSIQGASKKAEDEFKKQYSAVYNHLLQFKNELSKRNKEETGIRYEWYALQRCAATYYPEFEKEKVVWTPVNSEYSFTILAPGYYFNNSIFMITDCKVKYYCAIFNSLLIRKYLTFLFSSEENYTYASKENIEKIPFPPITSANQSTVQQIEFLVDKILEAKKQNKEADTSKWEKEIDQLVYKLYELTEEEIKIIEGEK